MTAKHNIRMIISESLISPRTTRHKVKISIRCQSKINPDKALKTSAHARLSETRFPPRWARIKLGDKNRLDIARRCASFLKKIISIKRYIKILESSKSEYGKFSGEASTRLQKKMSKQ